MTRLALAVPVTLVLAAAPSGCREESPHADGTPQPRRTAVPAGDVPDSTPHRPPVPEKAAGGAEAATPARGKPDPQEAVKLLEGLRALAGRGATSAMAPFVVDKARGRLARMKPEDVSALLSGEVTGSEVNGGRLLLRLRGGKAPYAAFFATDAGLRYDPDLSMKYREADPGPRFPENRDLTLAAATEGIEGKGRLVATIETSMGTLTCALFEDRAPRAVATFVGLARGLRAFRDYKTRRWVKRPFYDGLTFHRVIPRFMIQGGCPKGDGTGDPGFAFPDEFDLSLRHDRPGRLSLANSGPNTNGSQFFVTEVPAPWLDDHHTIFGQCEPVDVVREIARVPAADERPVEPVTIKRVAFRRED